MLFITAFELFISIWNIRNAVRGRDDGTYYIMMLHIEYILSPIGSEKKKNLCTIRQIL
jgi:hypothetical protein